MLLNIFSVEFFFLLDGSNFFPTSKARSHKNHNYAYSFLLVSSHSSNPVDSTLYISLKPFPVSWSSISFPSNHFFIPLPVIFCTENIITPFPCLKFFNKFPLPKQNMPTFWHCLHNALSFHPWQSDLTLSSNNTLHIRIWKWWLEIGFYWGMSEFCREFLKIINCLHLSARKFALETHMQSTQTIYILQSMSFWNNQKRILGTRDETAQWLQSYQSPRI